MQRLQRFWKKLDKASQKLTAKRENKTKKFGHSSP